MEMLERRSCEGGSAWVDGSSQSRQDGCFSCRLLSDDRSPDRRQISTLQLGASYYGLSEVPMFIFLKLQSHDYRQIVHRALLLLLVSIPGSLGHVVKCQPRVVIRQWLLYFLHRDPPRGLSIEAQ